MRRRDLTDPYEPKPDPLARHLLCDRCFSRVKQGLVSPVFSPCGVPHLARTAEWTVCGQRITEKWSTA